MTVVNVPIEKEITNKVNLITISRFILTIIAVLLIFTGNIKMLVIAYALMGFSEVTDIFDGYIARKENLVTNLGKILDPLSDSISRFFYFFALGYHGLFPIWFVVFFFFRDIIVAYVRIYASFSGTVLAARISGKLKAAFQFAGQYALMFILLIKTIHEGQSVSNSFLIWVTVIGVLLSLSSLIIFKIRGFLVWLVVILSFLLGGLLLTINYITYEINYFTSFTIGFLVISVTMFSLIDYVMSLKNRGGRKTRITFTILMVLFLLSISPYSLDLLKNKIESDHTPIEWKSVGDDLAKTYDKKIFGAIETGEYLIMSALDKNEKPVLVVFKSDNLVNPIKEISLDKSIGTVKDLEYDDGTIYLIDDGNNMIHLLDLEKSIINGKGIITKTLNTGLYYSGTIAIFRFNSKKYMVINDYFFDKELYFFDLESIDSKKELRKQVSYTVPSEMYVKAINTEDDKMFMLVNKLGNDLIYEVSISDMIFKSSVQKGIKQIYSTADRDFKGITVYNDRILTYGKRSGSIYIGSVK
ncbi:MAG: CDP-alcohol phosphatidyltransferase family protein [Candidatus Delongbacteria bacterium]|nr:CDP-alcohol phosphatidyltransferase family protein [Candidatus Delongbacteria bacterium]MBN2835653.1 CDP-alcohol phosphatidyltransferase family protein [Candidatus Delongbacteria bacterium]